MKRLFLASVIALMSVVNVLAGSPQQVKVDDVECGNKVTMTATAKAKYHFVEWLYNGSTFSGNQANPYTTPAIHENREYKVRWKLNPKVVVEVNDPAVGDAYIGAVGTTEEIVDKLGDNVTVTAEVLDDCYKFVGWKKKGAPDTDPYLATTLNYTVTNVGNPGSLIPATYPADQEDVLTLVAVFEIIKYSVTVISDDDDMGTVSAVEN